MIDMRVRSPDEFIAMEHAIADPLGFVTKLDEDYWRRPSSSTDHDGGTLVALTHEGFPTEEHRRLAAGGWPAFLEGIERLVSTAPARSKGQG